MKQFYNRKLLTVVAVVAVVLSSIVGALAFDRAASLRAKAESVKVGVNHWLRDGKDPSAPLDLLMKAKAAFDHNNADEGEALLNEALKVLGDDAKAAPADKPLMPFLLQKVRSSKLFAAPEEVIIEGYHEDCMEPFISRDGKYIFFNNSNAANVKTHIHLAKRIDRTHFKYLGELAGAESTAKDMAPTMDNANNMFFTSLRSINADRQSIYVGTFAAEKVQSVKTALPPRIFKRIPGWISMDCDITPDGKLLVVSRAFFGGSLDFPERSDLMLCDNVNGQWALNRYSDNMLAKLNTEALEYAPSINDNGLELYFTRTGLVRATKGWEVHSMIMLATRKA